MNDAADIRAHAIDQQVHADLAGYLSLAFQLATIHVHHYQIGRRHHAFRHAGGGHQNAVFVQADGKIPIGCGNKTEAVQHRAKPHDVAPGLVITTHVFQAARV